ncbi:glutaredoxin family protein [Variovorax sp. ZT4R33]|uniref:glutaredoxin family protein n=1 Tax=Variovorax sp. ZT4R33 TaxID=3443743 RepID=UPI003F44B635
MPRHARPSLLLLLTLALAASAASAQQVYRSVDKNGKAIFSDQPPAANAQPAAPRGGVSTVEGGGTIGGLPYELQQVVQRYPVTLYTREDCAPCDTGRALLNTRGVPFSERQVKTPQDAEALQRLSGESSLPLLTIGTQQLKGFADSTWSQYLDAAGYPKSVRLPAGYRNPPAQPMVAQQAAPSAPAAAAAATTSPTPAIPPPAPRSPSNPTGIQF